MNTQARPTPRTSASIAMARACGGGPPIINNQAALERPSALKAPAVGGRLSWLAVLLLAVLAVSAEVAAGRTPFRPVRDGFQFNNTFVNDAIKEVGWQTRGLCGGMSYAAADFFFAGRAIPSQNYRPATGSPLQEYIYNRQLKAFEVSLDKWAELNFNPGGVRDGEFFNWGLVARLQELRQKIDSGKPVPLGLQYYGGGLDNLGLNHYVLATGYDLGRYRGDGGAYAEDLRIFVYDPSDKGKERALAPSLSRKGFYFVDDTASIWRTYFVDTNYVPVIPKVPAPPPVVNDGRVREVLLAILTGDDDLRGGIDNVNVILHFRTWSHLFPIVNAGRRWLMNYDQTLSLVLPRDVSPTEITGVTLTTTLAGDNWNVNRIEMFPVINGTATSQLKREGNPRLFRFTGSAQAYSASVTKLALGGWEGIGYQGLPHAVAGRPYSVHLFSGGCQAKIAASTGLPSNSGLTLDEYGRLTGTPSPNSKGEFKLTFQVTDGCMPSPLTKSGTATLSIFDQLTLGQFEGTGYAGLPNAETGQPYSAQLLGGGCQGRVTTSTLPSNSGLKFDALGRLVGTAASNLKGDFRFTFQATDGCSPAMTKNGSATLKIVDVIAPVVQSVTVEPSSLPMEGGEVVLVVKTTDNIAVKVVMGIYGKPDGTSSGFPTQFNALTQDWRFKWTMPGNTGSSALTYTVKGRVSDEAGNLVESAPVTITVAGRTATPILRPPQLPPPPTFP